MIRSWMCDIFLAGEKAFDWRLKIDVTWSVSKQEKCITRVGVILFTLSKQVFCTSNCTFTETVTSREIWRRSDMVEITLFAELFIFLRDIVTGVVADDS